MAWLTGGTPFRALRQRSDAARRPEKWAATTIVAAHFSIDQASAPLMWNGAVTMLLATLRNCIAITLVSGLVAAGQMHRVWLFWSDTRERVLMRAVPLPGRTVWH